MCIYVVELVAAPHQSQTNGLLALSPCCYTSRFVPSTRHPSTRRGHAVFSLHDDPLIAEPPYIGACGPCWNEVDGIPSSKWWNSHSSKINFFLCLFKCFIQSLRFAKKKRCSSWKNPGLIGIFWF